MEFYDVLESVELVIPIGFNSQRDGILRLRCRLRYHRQNCFNSQRDGILPGIARQKTLSSASFNSQRDGILPDVGGAEKLKEYGFNSQRDGILQAPSIFAFGAEREFQFPTGWNSTDHFKAIRGCEKRFQFPTGWNSTS